EMVPLFADFLSIPLGAAYTPLDLHPDVQRRKTLAALAAWNLRLGALQPLIMLMEDLHWWLPVIAGADRAVGAAEPDRAGAPGLHREIGIPEPVGVAFEPDGVDPGPAHATPGARDGPTLGPTLPATAMDAIVARADGVPLYIEELTK